MLPSSEVMGSCVHQMLVQVTAAIFALLKRLHTRKKRKRGRGIDWEDLIIETLLLHRVKEEEIEKGRYDVLLEPYVFNSGVA
ncbi:hypothetical protein EV2_005043 [Malus domestica]